MPFPVVVGVSAGCLPFFSLAMVICSGSRPSCIECVSEQVLKIAAHGLVMALMYVENYKPSPVRGFLYYFIVN
jgi:hypothetical protein